jgi:hypothetical protein
MGHKNDKIKFIWPHCLSLWTQSNPKTNTNMPVFLFDHFIPLKMNNGMWNVSVGTFPLFRKENNTKQKKSHLMGKTSVWSFGTGDLIKIF